MNRINIKEKSMAENSIPEDRMVKVGLYGEVVDGVTLEQLQRQAGDIDSFDTLVMEIASPGGSVSEGIEIMMWLDELSASGKRIVTAVVANSYSIASLIMLAADMRFISKHGEVMVHNPMVPQLDYANANELEQYVSELRELEALMYDLYQVFTGLEKDVIKSLMDNETYLSPEEAVSHGFADTVIDINKRSYEMAVNLKKPINMSKTFNVLNRVIAMVNKSDFVNQLYYTKEGNGVEIYQADPSTYKIGDRVSTEEDGEMELSDGAKLMVEGGIIKEINRSVDEITAPTEEAPAPADDETVIEEMVEETVEDVPGAMPETTVEEVQAGEFNEGPAPIQEPTQPKGKDMMPAKVTEVTESITTKETVAMDEDSKMMDEDSTMKEAPEMMDDDSKMVVDAPGEVKAPLKMEDPYESKWAAFDERIAKLEARAEEAEAKLAHAGKFEDIATQAIDGIYKNTSSNFKPEAKAEIKLNSAPKGSIFSQMKQRAGLKVSANTNKPRK